MEQGLGRRQLPPYVLEIQSCKRKKVIENLLEERGASGVPGCPGLRGGGNVGLEHQLSPEKVMEVN